jgi:hypothetical protein
MNGLHAPVPRGPLPPGLRLALALAGRQRPVQDAMQNQDHAVNARSQGVHGLCREVGELVKLSREQRRTIDKLLSQLENVLRSAGLHRIVAGSGYSSGSYQG